MRYFSVATLLVIATALGVCVACDSADQAASSSQDLVSAGQATFPNFTDPNPSPPNHFATTSSISVVDATCGGTGNTYRTTVVWEEESAGSDDDPVRTFIGNECGFNPISINGGSAAELTTTLTGTPPEWSSEFPGVPMQWG